MNWQRGSSLIEIIIATGVMALVLTAIVAGMTMSLKTTAQSEYRTQAVKRAQEALEIFRRERTLLGWDSFSSELVDSGTYCFQTLPAPRTPFLLGACTDDSNIVISGVDFYRQAVVDIIAADSLQVTVTVNWDNGDGPRNVEITQVFRQWE
jgi:Tfp pilus assembly protein PilV